MIEHLKTKVSGAKTALVVDNPFIATLLLGQRVTWDDKMLPPTMITDGHMVTICPAYAERLSAQNMRFALANVTMRLVFNCNLRSRIGARDPVKWDIACDIVINAILAGNPGDTKNSGERRDGRSTVGEMPEGAVYNWDLYIKGGKTIEGVYAILPEPTQKDIGNRQGVVIFDGSDAEMTEEAARMHVRIAQARDIARAAGTLSENIARYVGAELTPKIRWQDVLREFFTRRMANEMSWARPSRRGLAQGVLRPGKDGQGMDEIAIAVDLSGSVTPDELQEFLTELRAIKTDCQPWMTHVLYFASEVTKYESFAQDDELQLKPNGTGGTAFSPIFRYCARHDIEPAAVVVLTDLYCADYGPTPAYPVLWVSTGAQGPTPFGQVTMLREQSL
jgi:predicted metal-dependent peptidase